LSFLSFLDDNVMKS